MKIGMYNRWLATLGGGEKHSLAVAEYLSKRHSVTVISHKPVSKAAAEERFHFDLSKVNFLTIPERSAVQITPLTADYDFFINASYMDFFPVLSKLSAALIYFPGKVNKSVIVRREIKHAVRKLLKLPALIAGVMSFDAINSSIEWLLDVKAQMQLPKSRSSYQIRFDLSCEDVRIKQVNIFMANQLVKTVEFQADHLVEQVVLEINPTSSTPPDMIIAVDPSIEADGNPKLRIRNLALSLPEFKLYHLLFERIWRSIGIRLQYFPPGISLIDYFQSYSMIWANSEFTRRWIKKYWGMESQVLYPPVDVDEFRPVEKKNYILNVGRFFAGQHNKKHQMLVEAFRQMVDAGLKGWELHLVGGVMAGEEHQAYYANIQKAVEGYPIVLHPDQTYKDLLHLYGESSIYWHASGYGEDENEHPDKFEHFGITTIEAMAAGCVPVVIGKGGQPEIVNHAENGFLWQTSEQLREFTLRMINDAAERRRLSEVCMQSSQRYDQQAFYKNLQSLLTEIDHSL